MSESSTRAGTRTGITDGVRESAAEGADDRRRADDSPDPFAFPVPGEPPEPPSRRSALGLAGLLIVAGIMHFVVPSLYERIVPSWAGDPKRVVRWSGWAEIACGTLVAIPKSRRLGGWASLVLLIAVYPANIKMALDAGTPRDAYSWGAWMRLPLQVPLWWWAARIARRG